MIARVVLIAAATVATLGGGNLLANVIGNYDGTVPISARGFLVIMSDGNWSVSVSP